MLKDLISGKRFKPRPPSANAKAANPANISNKTAFIESTLATLAGLALATDDHHQFKGAVEILTPKGNKLWIATEPEAVGLIPEGAVYFTGDEIMELQKVGKEAARMVLMVKQVFGNAATLEKRG